MDNMSHVLPGSSKHRRRSIARKVIRNTLKNYYDVVRLPHMTEEKLQRTIKMNGKEYLEEAHAQGKGAILVGGHIGNFSIVAQMSVIYGYDTAIVAEDIHPEKLYEYINHLRGRFGVKFIRMGSSQVRTIYKLLKGNGMLMLAADRDLSNSGVPVQFFDAPVDLPAGPVVLALRLNAPLIPAHTVRLRDNSSIVNVYPPMLDRTGDLDRDTKTNMRKVAQILEDMILKAPDQWVVLQRVWEQPAGAATTAEPVIEPAHTETPTPTEEVTTNNSHVPEPIPVGQESTRTEERSPSSVAT
jgi:KDO2-lipid IV(A) lauroyltransferase